MQPGAEAAKDRFAFLDYLRVFAAWTVVYDHMIAAWPAENGATLKTVAAVRMYIANPLGVIQDFGWIAVAVFFLISGFVITHVSAREGTAEFLIKRFFRIFPMLAIFVFLAIALNPSLRASMTPLDILRNITLTNYLSTPQIISVGVAWTLVIEVMFYLLTALTMWTGRQEIIIAVNLFIPLVAIRLSRHFGADFFLAAACLAYVPYLVVGQVFYFGLHRRSLGPGGMTAAILACFAVLLYGIMSILTAFLPVTNSYLVNFVYACIIFYICFCLNQRLAQNAVIKFLAASSFAVYLVHGVAGYPVFTFVWSHGQHDLAIVAALATTMAGAAFVHLVLERPILDVGRHLGRRFAPKAKFVAQAPPLPPATPPGWSA